MTPKRTMSEEHKRALARGRAAGRAVRTYLEALEAGRPQRGRKVTTEKLGIRLHDVDEQARGESDPIRRLNLVQEALDIKVELERREGTKGPDLAALERSFVEYAKTYAAAKGISYEAWREVGVSPAVLKAAGIKR